MESAGIRVDQTVTRPHDFRGSDPRLEPSQAWLTPTREPGAVAKLRDRDERGEQVTTFDVVAVHVRHGGAPPSQLSAEHIRVDDNRRTAGGHASAIAARNAASSSSVRSSITMSS